ncbi:MAG: ATP-binding cassette domain-containing protein [Aestuariivita sp.]|nr:ATP-binding cassette domain-containing protein [Aestuariivita sp.]
MAQFQLRCGHPTAHEPQSGGARGSDPCARRRPALSRKEGRGNPGRCPGRGPWARRYPRADGACAYPFPRLCERLSSKIRYLSGGGRQIVAIACGLLGDPRLMILDESALGLSHDALMAMLFRDSAA